jgi:hypothetical protein
MKMTKCANNAARSKAEKQDWYAFESTLGEVLYNAKYFFAFKERCLIGIFKTYEEAKESLVLKEKADKVRSIRFENAQTSRQRYGDRL